ncbi:response regulator [Zoogloea sp.]|uniref:response regulator n=1 Tax=Zoogloea sp. TaxID=49181 RepID=UPI00261639AD|nr:response regulator [Zoogloea sp.]
MHSQANAPVPTGPLLYQPRFDCRNGELAGAKLYIGRPDGPEKFVLDSPTGAALAPLRAACAQLAAWSRTHSQPLVLVFGARIGTLCEPAFAVALNAILLETQFEPQCLEICISTDERVSDASTAALRHLKNCGIRFTLSAASPALARLAWIRRLPLDSLEVPAHLVQDVVADPEGIAIVRALVTRAHTLRLVVSAKGVDSAHSASTMVALGCDLILGPLFGNPEPAGHFEALLATDRRLDPALLRGPRPERTLLLVDDEENILSSLRRLLRRDGYTILTATGGKAGLELMATQPVDVIVSDQRMPGMTGVEFLQKAKQMDPDSVRMVLSGYTDLQSVTDAINEGDIYKFLTKPWDDAMLRANINEAFQRKLLSDENRRLSAELAGANDALERINAQLKTVLADRERKLGMEEAALSMTHEALAVLPVPLLGIDSGGMIALANAAAERLFAQQAPLLGLGAEEVLPASCTLLLNAGEQHADLDLHGRSVRVEAHPLGSHGDVRGTLLSFTSRTITP